MFNRLREIQFSQRLLRCNERSNVFSAPPPLCARRVKSFKPHTIIIDQSSGALLRSLREIQFSQRLL